MICRACKAGRHTTDRPCPDCGLPVRDADGHTLVILKGEGCDTCHHAGYLPGCRGGTWCDCQHQPAQTPAILAPPAHKAGRVA